MPGVQDQFAQEFSVCQPANLIAGMVIDLAQMSTSQSGAAKVIGALILLKAFLRLLGQMAPTSSVVPLAPLHIWPFQYWLKIHISFRDLAPGKAQPQTSISSWSDQEQHWHINCLEIMAVFLSLRAFLPDVKGRYVLVLMDNAIVIAYINHQGGSQNVILRRSRSKFRAQSPKFRGMPPVSLAVQVSKCLLLWEEHYFVSAVHVSGRLNHGAHMLSWSRVSTREWRLQLQMFRQIWNIFGQEEVNLFASEENSYCPVFFSKKDTLTHE
ncbi:hypothetical protein H4Q32_029076 [Labeo rohita]|uniref:Uncharacterized protein n=1 Tax=Labeo rohita TaxID=84645 RepID=A0ABQ8MAD4_LABRO|nr:hypothetical protein H4Q32_029076 [Labeo rohita]